MKQKLFSFLCLAALLTAGVGSAKADTTEDFAPTSEVYFRTALNDGAYSWNSGYPKTPSESNLVFAGHHRAGMFVLMKFTVDNLASVNSLKLTLTGSASGDANGSDALAIWSFANDWSATSDAATLAAAVNAKVGLDLNTVGTATATPLKNMADMKDGVDTYYRACYYTLSGDALDELKANASADGTFTLLITNRTNDMANASSQDRKFYSSAHEKANYRPTLTATYSFTPVTVTDGTVTTAYNSLAEAMNALSSATSDEITITVNENQKMTSRLNAISGKTINFVAGRDNVTITNTASNSLSFLAGSSLPGTINVGNAAHRLTITYANPTTNSVVETNGTDEAASNAKINIENVTFKDIVSSNEYFGHIKARGSKATISLKDVIFDNCSVTAENMGIICPETNDRIYIGGTLAFNNCTGYDFRLKGRIRENGLTTPSQVFTIYSDGLNLSQSAVVTMNPANRESYVVVNEDRCVVPKGNTSNEELVVSEAYTLNVSAANAATLVLPFATTIPEGVTSYTLSYTAGNDYANATEVETTLPANTPVLINAAEAKYKFNAATRAKSSTPASTDVAEADRTAGALVGVYAETTVPAGCFILANNDGNLGFYKADGLTNKVRANRAYLKAEGAGARLNVVYGGEPTAIEAVNAAETGAVVYNLQGIRMNGTLTKGIYVKNGKKFIVK